MKPKFIQQADNRFIADVIDNEEYKYLFDGLIAPYKFPVVLDIGANIGCFSYYIYDYAGVIYAMELAGECIEVMKTIVSKNNLDKIKINHCAITKTTGKHRIIHASPEPFTGSWKTGNKVNGNIQGYSIFDFLKFNNINMVDLMKIDIEGTEISVFAAQDFPANKIKRIAGEYHTYGDCKDRLEQLGYKYEDKGGNHFLAIKL